MTNPPQPSPQSMADEPMDFETLLPELNPAQRKLLYQELVKVIPKEQKPKLWEDGIFISGYNDALTQTIKALEAYILGK